MNVIVVNEHFVFCFLSTTANPSIGNTAKISGNTKYVQLNTLNFEPFREYYLTAEVNYLGMDRGQSPPKRFGPRKYYRGQLSGIDILYLVYQSEIFRNIVFHNVKLTPAFGLQPQCHAEKNILKAIL